MAEGTGTSASITDARVTNSQMGIAAYLNAKVVLSNSKLHGGSLGGIFLNGSLELKTSEMLPGSLEISLLMIRD